MRQIGEQVRLVVFCTLALADGDLGFTTILLRRDQVGLNPPPCLRLLLLWSGITRRLVVYSVGDQLILVEPDLSNPRSTTLLWPGMLPRQKYCQGLPDHRPSCPCLFCTSVFYKTFILVLLGRVQ